MTATPTFWALLLAVLGSAIVIVTGQGTTAGALAGLVVAVIAIVGLGPGTLLPLAVFVLGAGILTRLGREAKERAGAAEPHRGRRGFTHVAAKLGLPTLLGAAGLAVGSGGSAGELLRVAFAASLCAAFADTAATEIGPLGSGGAATLRAWPPRRVPHGTPGGVSIAGVGAAAGAAALTAAAASVSGLIPAPAGVHAAAAGFAASLVESVLTLTRPGRALGHHGRNAAVSLLAAAVSCATWATTVARS